MSPQKERTPTQKWAYKAVYDFTERHPRATYIVNNLYEISDGMLVKWITLNGKRWTNYKKAVKYIDNCCLTWSGRNTMPSKCVVKQRIVIALGLSHTKILQKNHL